jgi:hypothetical protein
MPRTGSGHKGSWITFALLRAASGGFAASRAARAAADRCKFSKAVAISRLIGSASLIFLAPPLTCGKLAGQLKQGCSKLPEVMKLPKPPRVTLSVALLSAEAYKARAPRATFPCRIFEAEMMMV